MRHLPALCHDHLRRADVIYKRKGSDKRKQAALKRLIEESDTCERCRRLRQGKLKPSIMNRHEKPSWDGTNLVESLPYDAIEFTSTEDKRRAELERNGLYPASILSSALKQRLFAIEPSSHETRPAAVRLVDGFELPRVTFIDEGYGLKWWVGFWTRFVRADKVVEINESPFAMPPDIRRRLASVGETSMSSLEFRVTLRSGKCVPCWYSGFSSFIELPPPDEPSDIVDVEVDRGLVHGEPAVLTEPDFVWCVYK